MSTQQTRAPKQLTIEKLETRALLDGMSLFDGNMSLNPYNLQPGTGTLVGGGFPNETPAIPVSSMGDFSPTAGFGFAGNANLMPNTGSLGTIGLGRTGATGTITAGNARGTLDDGAELNDPRGDVQSDAPDAGSGVGQMTITTGANTPGIGSFATSTNGINSKSGGTGMPGGRAAQQKQLEEANEGQDDMFNSEGSTGIGAPKASGNSGAGGE